MTTSTAANQVSLRVEVPICAFPVAYDSEYRRTHKVPPFSTVYGMLLSIVGETLYDRHQGVKIAVCMESTPTISTVLRSETTGAFKGRRSVETLETGGLIYSPSGFTKPCPTEILHNLVFVVTIDSSGESGENTLASRITSAMKNPAQTSRFGVPTLGESEHLVETVKIVEEPHSDRWLVASPRGRHHLAIRSSLGSKKLGSLLGRFNYGPKTDQALVAV